MHDDPKTLEEAYETIARLHSAIDSRDVIGQAKGILMARGDICAQHAFDVLVSASQRENRKLRDVAAELVNRQVCLRCSPGAQMPLGTVLVERRLAW